ncbi:synaptic vesicle 2-related protein-like [Exaiptasia diaphana]|uniref:Uncharacterized protein n=1 Tax=Exaiptasia diaphana TaxID=2652724 RepID=A0A913XYQ5_EXADI|nr:synaptic vesicle 2-related protein-like [Exaiptasia diaphana]
MTLLPVRLTTSECKKRSISFSPSLVQSAGTGNVKNPHCGCKLLTTSDYTDMMWTTVSEVPIVVLNVILLEKLGRKKTLATLYSLTAFFFILLFICTSRAWMVAFIFGVRGCISGVFTATYIYTPEVRKTKLVLLRSDVVDWTTDYLID